MNEVKRRFWQWYHDRGLSVIDGYFDPKVIDRCLDQFDGYKLVREEDMLDTFSARLNHIERRLDALEAFKEEIRSSKPKREIFSGSVETGEKIISKVTLR